MPEKADPKIKPQLRLGQPGPPAEVPYAELQVTSNFTFLRGGSHPEELVARARELGLRALALTDLHTLAGMVRAHVAAKEAGLKLVVGTRVEMAWQWQLERSDGSPPEKIPLLLYPTNRASYARLCRLLTLGKRRSEKGQCQLTWQDVAAHHEGLLGIVVPPEGPFDAALWGRVLHDVREVFDDDRLSLAITNLYQPARRRRVETLLTLARELDVPLVASNDVHYHVPQRRALQDVLTCIRLGCTLTQAGGALLANAERYLKSPAEMTRLFADVPEAIARTVAIADRAQFAMDEIKYEYPHEICPAGKTQMEYLRELTWAGAAERYAARAPGASATGRPCPDERPFDSEPEPRTANREPRTEAFGVQPSGCPTETRNAKRETRNDRPLTEVTQDPRPKTQDPIGNRQSAIENPLIPPSVRARLEHEFRLIEELNYPAYFLTVYDLVKFARSRGILCQGRGAAANSAVCYCLGITAVDPARIDLLVERFISRERDEPPDIDIDFEHERREEVIQYLYQRYGRERAALCAEVISYRRRSAVREVGKVLGLSLDCVDRLAKSHDWWDPSLVGEQELRAMGLDANDVTIRRVAALARELLGFPRHLSQHVGGFVITETPLCELVPIENAAMEDRTVIEWDKDDIDAMGMLKVDVLGLGMMTAVRKCLELVNGETRTANREPRNEEKKLETRNSKLGTPLHFHTIPPEDPAVYDMLCRADSVGVFQVESRAQMSMLPRLKPRTFYDLVIEVAIVRPGPIQGGMVHPYLRRRNGEEPVEYPSAAIRQVLGRTLGVPLFQEQVMRIAMVAAGFTGGEADQLRRAMAAWKRKEHLIYNFIERIIPAMIQRGYAPAFARQICEQIKGFGEYGFPESHAASFALLVYASAWLKKYHPAAFCAALINSQPMGFYAPAQLVRDAREHGVCVLGVDVNHSAWDCTLTADPRAVDAPPALRLGMRIVRGLRQAEAEKITAAVAARGRYDSILALWRHSGVKVSTLQRLAEANAFESLGHDRQHALWEIARLRDGELPLLEGMPEPVQRHPLPAIPPARLIVQDYGAIGMSLRGHPLAFIREKLRAGGLLECAALKDPRRTPHNWPAGVAGLVLVRQRPGTASGIIFLTVEDETGVANLVVHPHVYEHFRGPLRGAVALAAWGHIERVGDIVHLIVREALDVNDLQHRATEIASVSRDFH